MLVLATGSRGNLCFDRRRREVASYRRRSRHSPGLGICVGMRAAGLCHAQLPRMAVYNRPCAMVLRARLDRIPIVGAWLSGARAVERAGVCGRWVGCNTQQWSTWPFGSARVRDVHPLLELNLFCSTSHDSPSLLPTCATHYRSLDPLSTRDS